MADGYIGADPDGAGKRVDTSELTVNSQTVERQRVTIGDPAQPEQFALVTGAGSLQVDPSGVTAPISAVSLPLPLGAAQDGSDGTGIAPPTGAVGIRGWLSGIYKTLTQGTLNVQSTVNPDFPVAADQQQVAGAPIVTTADGIPLTSIAGPTGDAVDTVGNSLSAFVQNKGGVAQAPGGQSSDLISGARLEVPFNSSGAQPVALTDVSNYRYLSLQINSVGTSGTVTPQISNDGITWFSTGLSVVTYGSGNPPANAFTTTGIWSGPVMARYFRLNITGITAGAVIGLLEFFALPPTGSPGTWVQQLAPSVLEADGVAGQTTSIIQDHNYVYNGSTWDRARSMVAGLSGGTTGLGLTGVGAMGGVGYPTFNPAPASAGTTNYFPLQLDNSGRLKVTVTNPSPVVSDTQQINGAPVVTTADGVQLVSIAGEGGDPINTVGGALAVSVVGGPLAVAPISGGTATYPVAVSSNPTTVRVGPGRLCKVVVTVAGTSTAMNIYDSASGASGTIIGVIPSGATSGQIFDLQMPVVNGITCSGSATNPAVTVSFI